MASKQRFARVNGGSVPANSKQSFLEFIQDYLPTNYSAEETPSGILIFGMDDHGWTLDGYVLPRLASALVAAKEIEAPSLDSQGIDDIRKHSIGDFVGALANLQAAACTYSIFLRRSKPHERKQLADRLSEAAVTYAAVHNKLTATQEAT